MEHVPTPIIRQRLLALGRGGAGDPDAHPGLGLGEHSGHADTVQAAMDGMGGLAHASEAQAARLVATAGVLAARAGPLQDLIHRFRVAASGPQE